MPSSVTTEPSGMSLGSSVSSGRCCENESVEIRRTRRTARQSRSKFIAQQCSSYNRRRFRAEYGVAKTDQMEPFQTSSLELHVCPTSLGTYQIYGRRSGECRL